MKFSLYQVDAFTNRLFGGNPAAVVPLQQWISDELMQALAEENNLSETVFFVPSSSTADHDFEIRWFTPAVEINLCGHATLASAYVLFNKLGFKKEAIRFHSKSGLLTVKQNSEGVISMDFPAWPPAPNSNYDADLLHALGDVTVTATAKHRDWLIELASEEMVRHCQPDFTLLKNLGEKLIITARGTDCDFVSRFFAPAAGVNEDPVTGSAHSQLIPYWVTKLDKNALYARQLSKRGGELWCEFLGNRVTIAGKCAFYMQGEIDITV